MSEEKKLTDEKLISEFEHFVKHGLCREKITIADILNLIHRLQSENKTLKAELCKECEEHKQFVDINEMVRIIQNAVGGCAKHWAELIAVALKKEGYVKNSSVALDYMDGYKLGFKEGVEALKIQAKERKFEIVTDAGNREDVVFVEDINEIVKELCE